MPSVMGSDQSAPCVPARAASPRVLHVIPTGLGRGAQVFARALVDQLGGLGGGHRLASLFDGEDGVEVDATFDLPGGPRAAVGLHPAAVVALAARLGRFEHDVVVAHGGDAFKYLALSSRSPLVYCVTGTWPAGARRGGRRLAWIALARRARTAAAVSDDVADDCRDVLSLRPDRVTVIPNGRDDARFVPRPRPSSGPVTLLFVGRLTAEKRPQLFFRLLERLRADGYPVSGRMVGAGPMETELRQRAASAGIQMLGWSRDVVPHLQGADVLVFPSAPDGEGMPGVLIEAGLCGIPAVSTRVAGASTVVEDGRTGLIVDVDDLDGLAGATAELVEDSRRRLALGAAARLRCEQRFSLEVVATRWDHLLRTTVDRRRRGAPDRPR
jgi:glycosyltransferase involved in cell wall biosynthesis